MSVTRLGCLSGLVFGSKRWICRNADFDKYVRQFSLNCEMKRSSRTERFIDARVQRRGES